MHIMKIDNIMKVHKNENLKQNTETGLLEDDDKSMDNIVASSAISIGSCGTSEDFSLLDKYNNIDNDDVDENSTRGDQKEVEIRNVQRLRYIMIFSILFVTILAIFGVYFYISKTELHEFEKDFQYEAMKVITTLQQNSISTLKALDMLSGRITDYTINSQSKWPYITIPNSAHLFQPFLGMAHATAAIFMIPIISARQRTKWEEYVSEHQDWVDEDLILMSQDFNNDDDANMNITNDDIIFDNENQKSVVSTNIKNYDGGVDTTGSSGPYAVQWQYAPVISNRYYINFNRLSIDDFQNEFMAVEKGSAVLSKIWSYNKPTTTLDSNTTKDDEFDFINEIFIAGGDDNGKMYTPGEPISYLSIPIFDSFQKDSRLVVGVLTAMIHWRSYFEYILPNTGLGIVCVIENTMGQKFSYRIDGKYVTFLGMEDLHDTKYDKYMVSAKYGTIGFMNRVDGEDEYNNYHGVPLENEYISYTIGIYPSSDFEDEYVTAAPFIYSAVIFSLFFVLTLLFLSYVWVIERRQNVVSVKAEQAQAVVSSLFPKSVGERLMAEAGENRTKREQKRPSAYIDNGTNSFDKKSDHIADFFPETTIMFADIKGFTSWASVREPANVFILLERIFGAFDEIASKRKVFKVETVGDCYVAVCGLPDPCPGHAVVMAKFANECRRKMRNVICELETELGPGTSELTMRFGLHSGPVTAGCLRGRNSRFQLFGDTMNTASRMESTSLRGKIQISEQTADLLVSAGKAHWVAQREGLVEVKGKGALKTFWLEVNNKGRSARGSVIEGVSVSDPSSDDQDTQHHMIEHEEKQTRLILWNVEILKRVLKKILAKRETAKTPYIPVSRKTEIASCQPYVLDEVKEYIALPAYIDGTLPINIDHIKLDACVEKQLYEYVQCISKLYKNNPFHDFEHATHVAMSVKKLFSRIICRTDVSSNDLHDGTYGIASDPISRFASIITALTHDAYHPGIPNFLMDPEIKKKYCNRSVAEQQSIDLSWALLMEDRFRDLRAAIYCNPDEFQRFRAMVVNCIVATDIFDPEHKAFREARWKKVFSSTNVDLQLDENSSKNLSDRRATIVMEHLIQASDVSHCMQHFLIYEKWNKRLFNEMMVSYRTGKSDKNPADNWYEGELRFFDGYIIPLAQKLRECRVFGVSPDELLHNATQNRNEWERRGRTIVAEMLQDYKTNVKLSISTVEI